MLVRARIFEENDIEDRVNWINDPSINATMYFDLPASIDKTKEWYYNKNNSQRIDFVFETEDREIIAMGGYTHIDKERRNAEFYIMVKPNLHGRGIGMKTSIWLFNYAFLVLHLNKIYLYTNSDNISAYAIYEKGGFKLEGILRQHNIKNNKLVDRRFYGLLYEEWINMSWKKDNIEYEFYVD